MSWIYAVTIYPLELIYKSIYMLCAELTDSYGIALVVLSFCTFFAISPLKRLVSSVVEREHEIQDILQPQLKKIREESKGAERHARTTRLFKRYGYHPVMAIRSAFGVALQIPFLMAAYYMVEGLDILKGQSFWFLSDLSLPDGLLGGINLLPIVMTLINLVTVFTSNEMHRKDRMQAIAVAMLFLVLLYGAPSALLFYWTGNNVLYLLMNFRFFARAVHSLENSLGFVFSWGWKWLTAYAVEACLALTLGFFVPVNLYILNSSEFSFELSSVVLYFILVTFVAFIILAGISLFLRRMGWSKAATLYGILLAGLMIGFFLQSYVINADYGVLDGRAIDWSKFRTVAIVNTAIWTACIIVPFALWKWRGDAVCKVAKSMAVLLFAAQCVQTGYYTTTIHVGEKPTHYLSEKGLFNLSENRNIIVFILDTFQTSYFEELLEKDQNLKFVFKDFVFFPDMVGAYPTTLGALPQILTGKWYKNEVTYNEYIKQGWTDNKLYNKLMSKNFDCYIYTSSKYVYCDNFYIKNINKGRHVVKSLTKFIHDYYMVSSFKFMPHTLKRFFWIYTGEINSNIYIQNKEGVSRWTMEDDVGFVQKIRKAEFVTSKKNKFLVYHMMGAHPPYTMNSKMENVKNSTKHEQALGALNIVASYIDKLKEKNVYDNSAIFIMADHGREFPYLPLFMTKPVGRKNNVLKISNQQMSYEYIHDYFLYFSKLSSRMSSTGKERKFLHYTWDTKNIYSLPKLSEYSVNGHAYDNQSWSLTGKVYMPYGQKLDNDYSLGTSILFDAKGADQNVQYKRGGWSGQENNHTWTEGYSAELLFSIDNGKNRNLELEIVVSPFIKKDLSAQEVNVFANNVCVASWSIRKKGIFVARIPASIMQTNMLDIRFEISHPSSPKENGLNEDFRKLGIAVTKLCISEEGKGGVFGTPQTVQRTPQGSKIYSLGEKISFARSGASRNVQHKEKGWSGQEETHTWTEGSVAELDFKISGGTNRNLELALNAFPFLKKGLTAQPVKVFANNVLVAEWAISKTGEFKASISAAVMETDSLNIRFEIAHPSSPKENGMSGDARMLGMAVTQVCIRAQE